MIESESPLSVRRQCQLLCVNRNRLTPPPAKFTEEDAALCRLIDEIHLEDPAFGARKIRDVLKRHHGIETSRSRIARLMKLMRISAIYRRLRTSLPGKGEEHRVYPYLLAGGVGGPDEAWCADITYIRVGKGFAYLVAVMDWHTRAVLSWKLSNTLDTGFCLEAFRDAVRMAGRVPAIFNTDQGCQFTSRAWRECLESHGVRLSMDGKGRWVDKSCATPGLYGKALAQPQIRGGLPAGLSGPPRPRAIVETMVRALQHVASTSVAPRQNALGSLSP